MWMPLMDGDTHGWRALRYSPGKDYVEPSVDRCIGGIGQILSDLTEQLLTEVTLDDDITELPITTQDGGSDAHMTTCISYPP